METLTIIPNRWYSKSMNSAFTLNKGEEEDSTGILNTIFTNGWSTGQYLFEDAAICEMQNLLQAILQQTASSINYTSLAGHAGFSFQGNIPALDGYTSLFNATTNFVSISGGGYSHLSTIGAFADLLYHPNNAFWKFDANGIDARCTSQLNTTIAVSLLMIQASINVQLDLSRCKGNLERRY